MHLKYRLCPHQLYLNRAILQREDGKKAQKQAGKSLMLYNVGASDVKCVSFFKNIALPILQASPLSYSRFDISHWIGGVTSQAQSSLGPLEQIARSVVCTQKNVHSKSPYPSKCVL